MLFTSFILSGGWHFTTCFLWFILPYFICFYHSINILLVQKNFKIAAKNVQLAVVCPLIRLGVACQILSGFHSPATRTR